MCEKLQKHSSSFLSPFLSLSAFFLCFSTFTTLFCSLSMFASIFFMERERELTTHASFWRVNTRENRNRPVV